MKSPFSNCLLQANTNEDKAIPYEQKKYIFSYEKVLIQYHYSSGVVGK